MSPLIKAPTLISMPTNNVFSSSWVWKFYQMLGKAIIVAFLLMAKLALASRTPWWVMEQTKYILFNLGNSPNFMPIDI
jgi:hypothetical protein